MTKQQMQDSILFALDELGKVDNELRKFPFPEPDLTNKSWEDAFSEVCKQLGRADAIAGRARLWLEYAVKTLEQCVKEEFAALPDQNGPEGEGRTN